jgi:hypothetical protein
MKVDLQSIDRTQFYVNEHVLAGEAVYLVIPQHIGATWTRENKVFRSSVWDSNGELISAGFPKFTNWGEKPEVFPLPTTLTGTRIVEKLDGSLLIVSKWKGNYILRTRGTIDAHNLDNGHELAIFEETILPKLPFQEKETWDASILFEWTSPLQKIVLNYGDTPGWSLVGVVNHIDYSLWTQGALDAFAKDKGFARPVTYDFPTIEDLLANVESWTGKEGVCIYHGQNIHKVKSAWYLVRHHMKSELNNPEKVLDFWLANDKPNFEAFKDAIIKFDFELWQQPTIGFVSRICDAYKEVLEIIAGFERFIGETLKLGDPKDKKARGQMAAKVFGAYGNTNRATFLFKLLDGRPLADDDYKKLIYQVMK